MIARADDPEAFAFIVHLHDAARIQLNYRADQLRRDLQDTCLRIQDRHLRLRARELGDLAAQAAHIQAQPQHLGHVIQRYLPTVRDRAAVHRMVLAADRAHAVSRFSPFCDG